jgi:hypothetical protein
VSTQKYFVQAHTNKAIGESARNNGIIDIRCNDKLVASLQPTLNFGGKILIEGCPRASIIILGIQKLALAIISRESSNRVVDRAVSRHHP